MAAHGQMPGTLFSATDARKWAIPRLQIVPLPSSPQARRHGIDLVSHSVVTERQVAGANELMVIGLIFVSLLGPTPSQEWHTTSEFPHGIRDSGSALADFIQDCIHLALNPRVTNSQEQL